MKNGVGDGAQLSVRPPWAEEARQRVDEVWEILSAAHLAVFEYSHNPSEETFEALRAKIAKGREMVADVLGAQIESLTRLVAAKEDLYREARRLVDVRADECNRLAGECEALHSQLARLRSERLLDQEALRQAIDQPRSAWTPVLRYAIERARAALSDDAVDA